jgi:hypothetical protein
MSYFFVNILFFLLLFTTNNPIAIKATATTRKMETGIQGNLPGLAKVV